MAGPYSTDLRSRVLMAMEAGESPAAAAKRFAVGRSTAYGLDAGGQRRGAARGQADGRRSRARITGAVKTALLDLLGGEDNHLTLEQCRDRLAEQTGVRVHPWTVGRALRRAGWT